MPDIRHELIIGAPSEKVYSALTSQQGLSSWWTPGSIANAEADSIAHFPFGPTYYKEMKITELKPYRQIKWICIKGDDEWIGTTISFKLEAGDKSTLLKSYPETAGQMQQQKSNKVTLLIFQHDDWKVYSPMYAECSYTWAQFLRSLKLFCETGKGTPWPYQHST